MTRAVRNRVSRAFCRLGAAAAAMAGPLALGGCLNFLHPVDRPSLEHVALSQSVPRDCKNNVYVFMVNGNDPLSYGNFVGARDHLHALGFKTCYGQLFHGPWLAGELRRVHREQPDARFVVVGYSFGAPIARMLAKDAADEGIPIDLVVYLDAWGLSSSPSERFQAGRILHVQSGGAWWNRPTFLEEAENLQIAGSGHFEVPTHEQTLNLLVNEVTEVARRVPYQVVVDPSPVPPLVDPAPTPRPVTARKVSRPDDWDFLKPANVYGDTASPPARVVPATPTSIQPSAEGKPD